MAVKSAEEYAFALGMIDDDALFRHLFSSEALIAAYFERFSKSAGKGVDRRNGFQFEPQASSELTTVSEKCLSGTYRFSPYLENLKIKGRNKMPRLIGIPSIRDRIVLHQLNRFLANVFPTCVPRSVASTYVREIAADVAKEPAEEMWVCGTDIQAFYDNIVPVKLLQALRQKIATWQVLRLISRALSTPTVPKNSRRSSRSEFTPRVGVPQGLAISNILASIYMQDVDTAMRDLTVTYYRYVDDVLMYGQRDHVEKAFRSLRSRLVHRGLSLHPLSSGKSFIRPITERFGYLGYEFLHPVITVRESTVERLLQSMAAMFSGYVHNKARRLEKHKYLDSERLAEIFLMELNERITGAISEKQRYGWIAYFNQISDLSLLHRLDATIAGFFCRLEDFDRKPPKDLRRLSRAYFEMKFDPEGGYVRNYDAISTRSEKLEFLIKRGRIGPAEMLTDEQISDRYERYRSKILSEMHSDEGVIYG
ncbi:MAG: reverse transcriptase domain-containing protein [Rhodoferax sp.]|nr:reverse transcriptase domain-containing protein [Rhodoferax sp.]MDP3654056.1 reverse transcriptase domain-containing protein [Rhodoferax sp.]